MVLLISLSFIGEGFRSKRAFWRALAAAGLVSSLMYPTEAARALSYVIDALALFGAGLTLQANAAFAVAWGVIGMLLALQRLTAQEVVSEAKG
jgi:hypothetical protein